MYFICIPTLNLQNGVRDDDKTDGYCFPYEAANKKGIGRILVATREFISQKFNKLFDSSNINILLLYVLKKQLFYDIVGNIKAMELVLVDPGTVVGPNYSSKPICIECLHPGQDDIL